MQQPKVVVYSSRDKCPIKSSEEPLVSVIIPTYNRREMLKIALESINRQLYRNYQIIIVDDASTDGTAELVSNFYKNETLIQLSKQGGAAKARNEGIKRAKGDLIAFLDSDDEWLPEYLGLQVAAMVQNPIATMSFCGCLLLNPDGMRQEIIYQDSLRYSNLVHRLLFNTSFIITMSAVVARAEKIRRVGFLNESLQVAEDREFYIRLLQLGDDIIYVPEMLVLKNQGKDNLISDISTWKRNAMRMLNIFFSNSENQQYKYLEGRARGRIGIILLKRALGSNVSLASRLRILIIAISILARFARYLKKDIFNFLLKTPK